MQRRLTVVCLALLCSVAVAAQIKSWSSYEDYCRANPQAPTCTNGKPMKIQDMTAVAEQVAGYCIKNPHAPGCEGYCRKNPKSLACIDTKPVKPQEVANTSTPSKNGPEVRTAPGPSMIEIPAPVTHAAGRGAKTLALPADWRFAHPHPDLLVGINAAALRQSTTLQSLLGQLAAQLQVKPADLDAALKQTGDVDQYWMSFRPGDVLILAQGRMDAPSGMTSLSNGSAVYRISKSAAVMGRDTSVTSSVQRLKQHASLSSASARQMKDMGATSDVWVMGTRALLTRGKSAELSQDLSSYLLGVSFRNGFQADLQLNYATPAGAHKAFAFTKRATPPAESGIRMSSEMDGTAVRMHFAVDQAKLSAAANQVLASPLAKPWLEKAGQSIKTSDEMVIYGMPGGPKTIESKPNTAPPPGKLVIYGLPGGPKVM